MEQLLNELHNEFPKVNFKIDNETILAVIPRCGQFGMLMEGNTKINWNVARGANRVRIFYEQEYGMIRAGYAGKYAAVDDTGRISIHSTSHEAFAGRDLNFYHIAQIGVGPVFFWIAPYLHEMSDRGDILRWKQHSSK